LQSLKIAKQENTGLSEVTAHLNISELVRTQEQQSKCHPPM